MPKLKDPVGHFWERVHIGHPNTCWPWQGATNKGGYGIVRFSKRTWLAHRLAFTLIGNLLEDIEDVLHTCDNPPCCNPAHHYTGTDKENHMDAKERGRLYWASRSSCSQGHAYTVENVRIIHKDGHTTRICRTCDRNYQRRYRDRVIVRGTLL